MNCQFYVCKKQKNIDISMFFVFSSQPLPFSSFFFLLLQVFFPIQNVACAIFFASIVQTFLRLYIFLLSSQKLFFPAFLTVLTKYFARCSMSFAASIRYFSLIWYFFNLCCSVCRLICNFAAALEILPSASITAARMIRASTSSKYSFSGIWLS